MDERAWGGQVKTDKEKSQKFDTKPEIYQDPKHVLYRFFFFIILGDGLAHLP